MRLYLSSENLGNYPDIFLRLVGQNQKTAIIENAKDYIPVTDRKNKVQEHLEQFSGLGLNVEEIDLRKFFGKTGELSQKMKKFGAVFVFGGNTFILRRAMAVSGFDVITKDLLKKDKICYGGSSAGSCITAKSLRGIDKGDRPGPEDVPSNYPNKEIIWDGLGLVNFMVVPHYGSTWFAAEADATVKYLKEHNLPYKILRDGQVIVIDGDKEEFLA
jgi:dipeptidase E